MKLSDYISQSHLVGYKRPIYQIITEKIPTSMILYGNPGIGKSTLATIISEGLQIKTMKLNGATIRLNELSSILNDLSSTNETLIIIDEIHNQLKTQSKETD